MHQQYLPPPTEHTSRTGPKHGSKPRIDIRCGPCLESSVGVAYVCDGCLERDYVPVLTLG